MIRLTRLNGTSLFINAELIERWEATPDTVITLINGHHYVVRESVEEVLGAGVAFIATVKALADTSRDRASFRRAAGLDDADLPTDSPNAEGPAPTRTPKD